MKVTVDREKGFTLFRTLVEACAEKAYPFDIARVPHGKESLPQSLEWGSVTHALFLFCACYYMRGGIQSDTAIESLTRMYNESSELFDPQYINATANKIEDTIFKSLKRHGLGFSGRQIARFWIFNFQKLYQFWRGDPTLFFVGVGSYDDVCDRIIGKGKRKLENPNGFFGFRHKMVSMLMYFLISSKVIPKPVSYPVPVDFHVLRLLLAHEVLKVSFDTPADSNRGGFYSEILLKSAREITHSFCVLEGVDETLLCDSMWLFSNTLCNQHPGNKSEVVGERKGRKTKIKPFEYVWNQTTIDTFARSCGMCPIMSSCRHQIPAAPYYIQGKLLSRGPLQVPPQLSLTFNTPVRKLKTNYQPVHKRIVEVGSKPSHIQVNFKLKFDKKAKITAA